MDNYACFRGVTLKNTHSSEDYYSFEKLSKAEEGEDRRYDWVHDIDKASTDNRERICYLVGG